MPAQLLLDRVTHTGDVAGLSSYSGSLPAPLPGLLAGSYHVIVVTDSALQVPDVNRTNNTGVTSVTLSVQEPLLTNGTALSGTIANGQDLYYRLNVTPGTNVKLDATFAVAAEAEFRLSFGALPTVNSSDQSSTNLSNLQPELVLPSGQGGAYYIWLHGREGAGAGQPFTLQSSLMTFAVSAVTPSSASNQGPVTMDVTGSGFTPQTTVSIQGSSGPAVNAQTVILISANELYATFDLTTFPIGNYTVHVIDGSNSSTAPGSFQVTAQALPSLRWILAINGQGVVFYTNPPHANAPQSYIPPLTFPLTQSGSSGGGGDNVVSGPAKPFTVYVQVANLGTNDVNIPSFEMIVTHVLTNGIYVQPAKTLAPGKTELLVAAPTPDPLSPGTECDVSLKVLPPQTTLDWASQQLGSPPPNISQDAWNAILGDFAASVGQTQGSLDAALQADAIYLAQVGDSVTDQNALLAFELEKAENAIPMPILTSAWIARSPNRAWT